MRDLRVVLVVVAAGISIGIGVSVGEPTGPAALASQSHLVLQLDWLQNLIERIDEFLEALVDLLNTLSQLVGSEGGD